MLRARPLPVLLLLLAMTSVDAQRPPQPPAPLASYGEPAISPDRSETAFVSGGDIWTVHAAGGEARLLISHDANEMRPIYSPKGRMLALVSDRTGGY